MSRFYGAIGYITCGYCNAQIQSALYNENSDPYEINWEESIALFNTHRESCTPENPYTDDPNCYHGNPDDCGGFWEVGVPESGLKYCEY